MLRRFTVRYAIYSMLLDVASIGLGLALGTLLRRILPFGVVQFDPRYPEGLPPAVVYPLAMLLWLLIAFSVSLYDPRKSYKAVDEFQALAVTTGLFCLGLAGVLYFAFRDTSRMLVIYALALGLLVMVAWRVVMRIYFRAQRRSQTGAPLHRVLIVGAGDLGRRVGESLQEYGWTGLEVVGFLDDDPKKRTGPLILGKLDDVCRVVAKDDIHDVILALPPRAYERVNEIASSLHELPVEVRVVPDYFSLALYRATVDDFAGIPMINLRDPALNDYQRLMKRVMDLVIGVVATVIALPLMGAVAVAIKLDSAGPVLFRQKRVGENGRQFDMLKFRSMVVGAASLQEEVNHVSKDGELIHKQRGDPRVTRVGRFIRHFSLDELPQLFNVLRGDLSLVGPRPELPWLVQKYEPWQRKRFAVPQGLTGWWQVNGRSDKPMHLHTEEDLFYIQNYSVWLDLYILLKTPLVAVRGRGAF
jgi:exopolysaccharide biosynthesis polyprenyl glycosylphosphotransferase